MDMGTSNDGGGGCTGSSGGVLQEDAIKSLTISLHKIGAIKFGSFQLKSGIISPIYFDFRLIVSHPEILNLISEIIWKIMSENNLKYDTVCGVPYTAVPIATAISIQHGVPMILKRKEQKTYGTGNILEGSFKPNSSCLVIEDVVTTGSSVIETVEQLRAHDVQVSDTIVILNREQGADYNLSRNQIKLHSILGAHQILDVLHNEKLISFDHLTMSKQFFSESHALATENERLNSLVNTKIVPNIGSDHSKSLLRIMLKKQSNLALSADLHNYESVLTAVEQLADHICLVKIHMDSLNFESFEQVLVFRRKLLELAEKHSFMIMEDRKVADIGAIVQKQLESKPFEIAKLAHFITVHGLSGPGILKSISTSFPQLGMVLVAEMSSEGNLLNNEYKKNIYSMVTGYENFVAGFVSQSNFGHDSSKFLQFTPGVGLNVGGDNLGQQYCTVTDAIETRGADVIIVGRGILGQEQSKWVETAVEFKKQGWTSWKNRLLKKQL